MLFILSPVHFPLPASNGLLGDVAAHRLKPQEPDAFAFYSGIWHIDSLSGLGQFLHFPAWFISDFKVILAAEEWSKDKRHQEGLYTISVLSFRQTHSSVFKLGLSDRDICPIFWFLSNHFYAQQESKTLVLEGFVYLNNHSDVSYLMAHHIFDSHVDCMEFVA